MCGVSARFFSGVMDDLEVVRTGWWMGDCEEIGGRWNVSGDVRRGVGQAGGSRSKMGKCWEAWDTEVTGDTGVTWSGITWSTNEKFHKVGFGAKKKGELDRGEVITNDEKTVSRAYPSGVFLWRRKKKGRSALVNASCPGGQKGKLEERRDSWRTEIVLRTVVKVDWVRMLSSKLAFSR